MYEDFNEAPDCYFCAKERDNRSPVGRNFWTISRMYVCPICGNKRCPKATYHVFNCTRSNEPGQQGSRYEAPNNIDYISALENVVAAADGYIYSESSSSERQDTYTEYRRVRAMVEPWRGKPQRMATGQE